MPPSQLTADSFRSYPPRARALAVQHLALIQRMPVVFAALLMREITNYDWLFPAERRVLDDQFSYLGGLSGADFDRRMQAFAFSSLLPGLQHLDWIRRPEEFLEAFTAALWSSHQIDAFRSTATAYAQSWRSAFPEPRPPIPRLAIAVLGSELQAPGYPLFRKLRAHGVFIQRIDPTGAWPFLLQSVCARAAQHSLEYGHWYIDGSAPQPIQNSRLNTISWEKLAPVRAAMLRRMQSVIGSGHGGPEELRTLMAETTTREVGLTSPDEVLSRFQLSILAQGSGTQIFSTTFVQWTAREALRRAQPSTLLLRFAPRQRQLPMNELLAGTADRNASDPQGSLIDADMGAYYTWIDQQRLTGASQASFVAWSEAHGQAVVIGPTAPRGALAAGPLTMSQIFAQIL